jgi:hypothetical protein
MSHGDGETTWRVLPGVPSGAWHAERVRSGVPLRATAFRLEDGSLGVYSPLRGLGEAAHGELAARGEPRLLVAPNHYHNLGLGEHARRYPRATVVASATAVPRLVGKTKLSVRDRAAIELPLPAGGSWLAPPAMRNGELWISLPAADGTAWLVGDGFFNIARTPPTPMGALLRLLGIGAGLRIGASYKWFIGDRPAYRRWLLEAIDRERPSTLIPCHGDVLTDPELPSRLRRLVESRI